MNEFLILRLASHSDGGIPWLVWSQNSHEVIASGEVAGAEQLKELQVWAGEREIIALAPSQDCGLKSLNIPKKGRRQAMNALAYMLEDEIAEDVEQIHVTVVGSDQEHVEVCYTSHQKMAIWLEWLHDAELHVDKILPDVLALPDVEQDGPWHVVEVCGVWLMRASGAQSLAFDDESWFKAWLKHAELPEQGFVSHTPWPEAIELENVTTELAELPMTALAGGAISSGCNMRQGAYRSRRKKNQIDLRPWYAVASLACIALVLYLVQLGLKLNTLSQLEDELKTQVVQVYQKAYPNEKRVKNPRSQMRQKLKLAGASGDGEELSFLQVLSDIGPAYTKVSGLTFESVRFDAKRQELRVQITASDFQKFEQFKSTIQSPYQVEVGALNSSSGTVSGTVTIRRAS